VDVFDMGSSQDAYGAYHHDMREGKDVGVGQESEELGGALAFWKDRFFVSVIPLRVDAEAGEAVLELGERVAAAIPGVGAVPDLVSLLPRKGLLPSQIHYFRGWLLLTRHLPLGPNDFLLLENDTGGVLARYRFAAGSGAAPGAAPSALLLIRYPSSSRAEQARDGFVDAYLLAAGEDLVGRTESGRWAGAQTFGDLLVCALDMPSRGDVLRLIGAAERTEANPQRRR
jgi:hypothetical protein